jgi:ArsR family transcriptional regulator, zinc-responsive transcriptional repressor
MYHYVCMSSPSIVREYEKVGELFAALSSPARSAIVHRLTKGESTVGELVAALGLSQPLVSQHLRVLRGAHLVTRERRGREVAYALSDKHVAHVFLDALDHTKETHHDDH